MIEFNGFLHASLAEVSDAALYEAALTTTKLTVGRPDLAAALINKGVHVTVIGKDENLTERCSRIFYPWSWLGLGSKGRTNKFDACLIVCRRKSLLHADECGSVLWGEYLHS